MLQVVSTSDLMIFSSPVVVVTDSTTMEEALANF
jgi:hypothetical protein